MKKIICEWPTTPLYHEYHDHEWGRSIHDDRLQFEHLCLESLQCGLSWLTILNKRDIIRGCFDNFDIEAVSSYGESDIDRHIHVVTDIKNPIGNDGDKVYLVEHLE